MTAVINRLVYQVYSLYTILWKEKNEKTFVIFCKEVN